MVVPIWGFPGGAVVKNPLANSGDVGSTLGLGRSPGEGNGNPLQYSCLGNPVDRGAWRATVQGVAKSHERATEQSAVLIVTFIGAHMAVSRVGGITLPAKGRLVKAVVFPVVMYGC